MRRGKQFLYGIFHLAVLGLFGLIMYQVFIRPAPSCTNSRKDRGEAGVDCGGVCRNICLSADHRPLDASAVRILPLDASSTRSSFLVEVRNPNLDHDALFVYSLAVAETHGSTSNPDQGTGYIKAGEIKYLAFPNKGTFEGITAADFEIRSTVWRKTEETRKPDMNVNILEASGGTDAVPPVVTMRGRLTNNDVAAIQAAELVALFHDEDGVLVGVSATLLNDIAPREAREWTILHPGLPGLIPRRTRIIPYAYIAQ